MNDARWIRMKAAPAYLGMSRRVFNQVIRPYVVEIPIGKQGIAFDRLDLDRAADEYKSRNGRPVRGGDAWVARKRQDSSSATVSGTSTKSRTDRELEALLESATSKKRSANSRVASKR